ncbi:uncharacterized protein LOC118193282 [Stegodyphus dumicola]|uniref:uncharacterized protein LOC118193282 n=1 Tax=Stegodyphus dumicola TaxID=202533 RepID=UPI0015AD9A33|nr:uncharacterized protein LOC118193282 [Stegodyphus dumicola]
MAFNDFTAPDFMIAGLLMITVALLLITLPVISVGLKITRFEVPTLVVPGDSAVLTCFFDLGKEKLYSVKWYKDHVEFFRFFPSLSPQFMAFPAPGLDIDMARSSPNTVYLRNLTLKSEGQYTCQVSADEPYFGCVQVHRDVVVYTLRELPKDLALWRAQVDPVAGGRQNEARREKILSWFAGFYCIVVVLPSSIERTPEGPGFVKSSSGSCSRRSSEES